MKSEAQPLFAHLENKTETTVCGKQIAYGTLCGEPVGIVVCGVGKVNAACGTQYAIDQMYADAIINIGVAGGLNASLKVGEIYCIERAVEYDFDLVQLNHTPIGTLNEFSTRYLPVKKVKGYAAKTLGTGDRFNDNPADFALLTKEIKADIRDMEGAAIVHAAVHAKVPVYAFKCISDVAGSGSTTAQFEQNMKLCAANLTKEIPQMMKALHG
jgi:adenosylhomocysteine nucleosidase